MANSRKAAPRAAAADATGTASGFGTDVLEELMGKAETSLEQARERTRSQDGGLPATPWGHPVSTGKMIEEWVPMRHVSAVILASALVLVAAIAFVIHAQTAAELGIPSERKAVRMQPHQRVRNSAAVKELREHLRTDAAVQRTALRQNPSAQRQDEEKLERVILSDPDPSERATAVFVLSGSQDEEALDVLTAALRDAEPEVRLAAVRALGNHVEHIGAEVLAPALGDPDPRIRLEALVLLGFMDGQEVVDAVRQALNDDDEEVRAQAEVLDGRLDSRSGEQIRAWLHSL